MLNSNNNIRILLLKIANKNKLKILREFKVVHFSVMQFLIFII